jgi:hypothetical protein
MKVEEWDKNYMEVKGWAENGRKVEGWDWNEWRLKEGVKNEVKGQDRNGMQVEIETEMEQMLWVLREVTGVD